MNTHYATLSGPKTAFSLVELSIVLVILGLLAGGVLSGQSLIRAAELKAVTTESQRYTSAVMTFRDKYFALPGDMSNATQFWGFLGTTAAASCAGSGTAVASGTCNGNGDGVLDYGPASDTAEAYQAWAQLANAGLIEGKYTGIAGAGTGGNEYKLGENCPQSKIRNSGWTLSYIDNTGAGSPHIYANNYKNWMTIGSQQTDKNFIDDPLLKAEEAWNIDTKLDDGKPGTGAVQAMGLTYHCATSDSNTAYTSDYKLNTTGNACALLIKY